MNVAITMLHGDPSNQLVCEIVDAIPGVNVVAWDYLGPFFAERFQMPFLLIEGDGARCGIDGTEGFAGGGARYHGIDGIEWFAESMRRRRNKSVPSRNQVR